MIWFINTLNRIIKELTTLNWKLSKIDEKIMIEEPNIKEVKEQKDSIKSIETKIKKDFPYLE